jgi:hypothetical protein
VESGIERGIGESKILGLSTTVMTADHPRYSTSDDLLDGALSLDTRAQLGQKP